MGFLAFKIIRNEFICIHVIFLSATRYLQHQLVRNEKRGRSIFYLLWQKSIHMYQMGCAGHAIETKNLLRIKYAWVIDCTIAIVTKQNQT